MCTTDHAVTTGDRKVCTVALTDDERFAAAYALIDDMRDLAESLVHQHGVFAESQKDHVWIAARDVAGMARQIGHLLPTLDSLLAEDGTLS